MECTGFVMELGRFKSAGKGETEFVGTLEERMGERERKKGDEGMGERETCITVLEQ